MPAMLEDPKRAATYRTSGPPPYPSPEDTVPPATICSRVVTLRDRNTLATVFPFVTATHVPPLLLKYLCDTFNIEIEKGDSYPMVDIMSLEGFATYWFLNFGAIMILGDIAATEDLARMEEEGANWEDLCLGFFYCKPNYPGRSSHVCNGGFVVTPAARNKGVGRQMGEVYLEWAPKLVPSSFEELRKRCSDFQQGYTYTVFNLVYENNVASMRIWDALGFKRVGRIKGCGNLKSYPHELVDAIIYGRELGPEAEDYVSEERFEKIRFYLKEGKYPQGADRAEKSRLRSAATHYKLLPAEDEADRRRRGEDTERLMLKDKEVISDPKRQYDIAKNVHQQSHGGINKTTATIAEKYHWVRIKETVSLVIKNCHECKDSALKNPVPRRKGPPPEPPQHVIDKLLSFSKPPPAAETQSTEQAPEGSEAAAQSNQPLFAPIAPMQSNERYTTNIPLDPQIVHDNRENTEDLQNRDFAERLQRIEDFNRAGNPAEEQDELSMDVDQVTSTPSHPQDDTRMASRRHMRSGDDPLSYQQPDGHQVQVRVPQQSLYGRYDVMES